MKLKKILAMTLTMAMMVLSFAGCGKEESYLSFDELYSNLTSSIDFSASNMQKQGEAALNNYYYIDPATLESYAIYMSDYATGNADEIAMFQVKEEDQVPADVTKERFNRLLALVQEQGRIRSSRFAGTVQEVLVEEESKEKGIFTGRTQYNLLVHFPADESLLGTYVNVKLEECKGFYYLGSLAD